MGPIFGGCRVYVGFDAAVSQCLQRSQRASLWGHLLPCEVKGNVIFRTTSMVMGLIYDLVLLRFCTYPYRLVDLISEDEATQAEAAILYWSVPACQLDSYSQRLRERMTEPSDLLAGPVQRELKTVLSSLSCNTYDTERLHSRNLRRLRARRHTHVMTLQDISVPHVGFTTPHSASSIFAMQDGAEKRRSKLSKDKVAEAEGAMTSNDAMPDGHLAHRRGGAWRAFCHLEGQGQQANFKSLAAAYRNLDDEGKNKYRKLGKMATQAAKYDSRAFPETLSMAVKRLSKTAMPMSSNPADRSQIGIEHVEQPVLDRVDAPGAVDATSRTPFPNTSSS